MWKELEKQKVVRLNDRIGNLNEVDNINCDKCKNKGYTVVLDENYNMKSIECECVKKRNIYWELKNSGLEDDFKTYTFDNYLTKYDWQAKNKELAKKYVNEATDEWLIISGKTGSGKTHLATAISQELIKKGNTYKYMQFTDEIGRLLRLSNSFGENMATEYNKELRKLTEPDILYIDDFLKTDDRTLNAVFNLTFTIIDKRYKDNKKTIITTEKNLNEIANYDEAVFWRIGQKAKGYTLTNMGDDKNIREQMVNK